MRRLSIVSALTAVFLTAHVTPLALADTLFSQVSGLYRVEAAKSRIDFTVRQVGGGGIKGTFGEFDGKIEIDGGDMSRSKAEFRIASASITTGVPHIEAFLRGRAMLDAERNPEIVFHSTKITHTGPQSAVLTGLLTMRGRRKPAVFNIELVEKAGRRIVLRVTGDIRRSAFGMQFGYPIYSNIVSFDMRLTGRRG